MRNCKRFILTFMSFIALLALCFYLHPLPLLVSKQQMSQLMEDAEEANKERLMKVAKVCSAYNLGRYKLSSSGQNKIKHPPTPLYSVFYVDKKHKLAYCPIYKAGSSTWLFNLCLLGGYTEEQIKTSNDQLSKIARKLYPDIDTPQIIEAVNNSMKMMVVRHPFERLLSAYRDKLENSNAPNGASHFFNKYGSKIVAKYRKKMMETDKVLRPGTYHYDPNRPKPSGREPTFREFVRYLLDTDLVHYADEHWIPYYLYCTPCFLDFNYIAKVETLDRDQMYLIEKAGLTNEISPRWHHKLSSYPSLSRLYFAQLTRKEIRDLYKKYRLDFEMFDYSLNPYFQFAMG